MKIEINFMKKMKIHKYVEIQQHATVLSVGQRKIKIEIKKNTFGQMKMEM